MNDVKMISELDIIITKIRILLDIYNHKNTVERKAPQAINSNDGFFANSWKSIKNTVNDGAYKKATEAIEQKTYIFNQLSDVQIYVYESKERLENLIRKYTSIAFKLQNQIFINDTYNLGKIEFIINIITNTTINYSYNDHAFSFISTNVFGKDINYIQQIKDDLFEAYKAISLNNDGISKYKYMPALLTGILICSAFIPVIGGLSASAAVTTSSLAGIFPGIGMAEGVIALCGCAAVAPIVVNKALDIGNNAIQVASIKKDFKKLELNEATFSLAKSILFIVEIYKYREQDSKAEYLYSTYIENYLDIKTDITLDMLMSTNSKMNYEKLTVFNNVDKYLVKKLKLA